MKHFYMLLLASLTYVEGYTQEINFSRVQDMTTWYNPSLKTDKQNTLKLNYRNVSYQGLIAYNSTSAMIDVPLLSKEGKGKQKSGYMSAGVGAASDKSNQGILSNTLGIVSLAYAVPVGGDEVYFAGGVQAGYFRSRLKTEGLIAFGDQYDKYGPIEGSRSADQLANGWSYNYLNMSSGISLFGNSASGKWHIGVSATNLNKPFMDIDKTETFRQHVGLSIQGGYKFITPENDDCAFYSSLNWQGKAFKHFFNGSYFKALKGFDGGIGIGLGYRYDDAIVPNIELRYTKAVLAMSYDVNVSSIKASGVSRNGMELAVRFDF